MTVSTVGGKGRGCTVAGTGWAAPDPGCSSGSCHS